MMAVRRNHGEPAYAPRGRLLVDEPMAKHTSWRVGGIADRYFIPADRDDLVDFLKHLEAGSNLTWIGLGSNVLVRDGGIRGVVIATHRCLGRIERLGAAGVYAEAGVPGAKLARFCVRNGLRGAEFFAGIPGTLGGALAMNAGAFGGETWDVVVEVDTVSRDGRVHRRAPSEYEIGYREVTPPAAEWFLAARLGLLQGDGAAGQALIRDFLARRAQTQPIQIPNAGSVFRNPPGDFAARLIETSGGKGMSEGQACVSERHANFIVNRGGATAEQVERLIERIRERVLDVHGVRLETEVRVLGDRP